MARKRLHRSTARGSAPAASVTTRVLAANIEGALAGRIALGERPRLRSFIEIGGHALFANL